MPYIVTTTTPSADLGWRSEDPAQADVTRRAVATLDEARRAALDLYEESAGLVASGATADTFGEQGGTVTLPDGTVIEVEPVSEATLYNAIRPTLCCPTCGVQQSHVSGSHLIAAYNAAQEER